MKLFEIMLTALIALRVIRYAIGLSVGSRTRLIVAFLTLSGLAAHVAFDGPRIQMSLIYFLYAIVPIRYGWNRWIRRGKRNDGGPGPFKRISVGMLGFITMGLTLWIALFALPIVRLPEPTGPYPIGTVSFVWTDMSREEAYVAGSRREVAVRAWYPARLADGSHRAPFAYERSQLWTIARQAPARAILASLMSARTHSYLSADVSSELSAYPVLLFSPGYGTSPYMYTSFIEDLASHGYIVFAAEHSYFSMMPSLSATGEVRSGMVDLEPFDWLQMDKDTQTRVEDMKFVLDRLEQLNAEGTGSLFGGKLDLQRIGAFGHSGGGAVAAQLMNQDSRVIAAVHMDGFPYGARIDNGLPGPFLYMLAPENVAFAAKQLDEAVWSDPNEYPGLRTIDEYEREAEEVHVRTEGLIKHGGAIWVAEGADHFSFSDMPLVSPLLFPKDEELQSTIKRKLLTFFDTQVKAHSPIQSKIVPD